MDDRTVDDACVPTSATPIRAAPRVYAPKLRQASDAPGAWWAACTADSVGNASELRPVQVWTVPMVCELVCMSTPLTTSIREWWRPKNASLSANGA